MERLVLVVRLHVDESAIDAFERFERDAARIMARHGGRIERVLRRASTSAGDEPFEVHLVSFPDEAAFDAYRDDPDTRALAPTREALVRETSVFRARERSGYMPLPEGIDETVPVPALSSRWSETPERLSATFVLPSFRDALAFMSDCAGAIDALDHHPDWTNGHRRVHVVLTTHSAGDRVTELDRRLAAVLDEVYESRVGKASGVEAR